MIFDLSASCMFRQHDTKAMLYKSKANGAYISVKEAQANKTGDGFYLSN
jgi:hypothetical protein